MVKIVSLTGYFRHESSLFFGEAADAILNRHGKETMMQQLERMWRDYTEKRRPEEWVKSRCCGGTGPGSGGAGETGTEAAPVAGRGRGRVAAGL